MQNTSESRDKGQPSMDASENQLEPKNIPAALEANVPIGLRILGILCILAGLALTPNIVENAISIAVAFQQNQLTDETTITRVLLIVLIAINSITLISFILFGMRLVLGRRRGARITSEVVVWMLVADVVCYLMLFGMRPLVFIYVLTLVVLVAIQAYIDPSVTGDRELKRKLRDMELQEDAEEGTLGLDPSGKGFIRLDFFNLFWIFVLACIAGDIIETIYHVAVVDPGHFQNRTGMLWGPFSPIYGFGAVLMTVALNRFHKANIFVVFVVSALIGGAFEYFVSWFMQFAFGIVAWDYSGTFLNIDGRTNFFFMCMWGLLGVVWIKLCLPWILRVVNMIPWKWRYSITSVAAIFMLVDGAMTLLTLDCWYERMAGIAPTNAIEQFCAAHFDNDWMKSHFQSMSIDPSLSTRA